MPIQDVTRLVERLEAFEDRLGVRLEALSAAMWEDDDGVRLRVRGELHLKSGTGLQQNVELVAAVYDSPTRIVGTDHRYFYTAKFFGFEVFEMRVELDPVLKLTRIRVYPKQW